MKKESEFLKSPEQLIQFLCRSERSVGSSHNIVVSEKIKTHCTELGYNVDTLQTSYTGWQQLCDPELRLYFVDGTSSAVGCYPVVLSGSTNGVVKGKLQPDGDVVTSDSLSWKGLSLAGGERGARISYGRVISAKSGIWPVALKEGEDHQPHVMVSPRSWRAINDHIKRKELDAVTLNVGAKVTHGLQITSVIAKPQANRHPAIEIGTHFDSFPWGVGAHDNASGTEVTLKCSRLLKDNNNIGFNFFNGEERGMLGSADYVTRRVQEDTLKYLRCYLNLDSVGWGNEIRLLASPSISNIVESIVEPLRSKYGVDIAVISRDNIMPYDTGPFIDHGVPSVQIGTGISQRLFPYYHQPHDSPNLLNYELMGKVEQLTTVLAERLVSLTPSR